MLISKGIVGKAPISAVVLMLSLSSVAQAGVHWGKWKRDGCTKPGYRQYSSILWDIPWGASWEMTCTKTMISGQTGAKGLPAGHPEKVSRCKNVGGRMWGEVDVRDNSCDLKTKAPDLKWGDFKKDNCMGDQLRQYSAQLMNVPGGMSWQDACEAAKHIGYGSTAGSNDLKSRLDKDSDESLPDRCEQGAAVGIATGIWGEFDVTDSSCKLNMGDLTWGSWKRGDCITVPLSLDENGLPSGSRKLREYSSVLWNIPNGQDWEKACSKMKVEIPYGDNQVFTREHPDLCVKATGNDVFRLSSMLATTAAGYIKGIGTAGSIGLDTAGVVLDLVSGSGEIGAFNIWGIVYDGSDSTCNE
jgi:hypothetical protein